MPGTDLAPSDYAGVPKSTVTVRGGPLDGETVEAPIFAQAMLFLRWGAKQAVLFGDEDSFDEPKLKRKQERALYRRVQVGEDLFYELVSHKRR